MYKYADTAKYFNRPIFLYVQEHRKFSVIVGLLLMFSIFALPSTVYSNNVSDACGGCHLSTKNGKDAKNPPPVAQDLSHSVHKEFKCIECHEYHSEVKVEPGRKAHAPFKNVDCSLCHVAKSRYLEKDPHDIAWKNGKLKSSACVTCHGYHDIQNSSNEEYVLNKKNIKGFCQSCHKGITPPDRYHKEDVLSKKVCLSCHNDKHQKLEDYHLNISVFNKSVHHVQECIDCHSDIEDIPHPMKLKEVDCIKCHQKYVYKTGGESYTDEYTESVHGAAKILNGNKNAPWCSDCHGTHNIFPASDEDSSISHKNVVATCGNCHKHNGANGKKEGKTSVEQYNTDAHKKLFAKNPDLAKAVCIECHGEHTIPARHEIPIITSVGKGNEPVPFNHVLHESKIQPCSKCHHRQLKPCSDCHTEKGDLLGGGITSYQAYHWPDVSHSCVGCHDEEKKKEDCTICHGVMSKGSIESSCYICHTGEHGYENGARIQIDPSSLLPKGLPDVIDIKILKKELGKVKFPHMHVIESMNDKLLLENSLAKTFHAGRPVVCIVCHHHSPIGDKPPPCSSCHKDKVDSRNADKPSLADALHKNCFSCHQNLLKNDYTKSEKNLLKNGDAKLIMEPTSFKDDKSVKIHVLCTKCHENNNWAFSGINSCAECHEEIVKNTSLGIHMDNCVECHTPHDWNLEKKIVCTKCHEKDVASKITVKAHLSEQNCQGCHKTHKWVDTRRFSVCEGCHRKKDVSKVSKLHKVPPHSRCGTCHDPHTTKVESPGKCLNCHRGLPAVCEKDPKKSCYDSKCHDFWHPDNRAAKN